MHTKTPLRDVKYVKKLAKQANTSHPHLSYYQRLDMISQKLFGVRNYRDLRRRAISMVHAHCKPLDGFAYGCSLCGFTFVPDSPEECAAHEEIHLRFEEALYALFRLPPPYAEREKSKQQGYIAASEALSAQEEVAGIEMMVQAWFDHSLESAIVNGYWKQHPSFDDFAAMVFHLVEPHLKLGRDLYLAKYGETPGEIEPGKSYWYPSRFLARLVNPAFTPGSDSQ